MIQAESMSVECFRYILSHRATDRLLEVAIQEQFDEEFDNSELEGRFIKSDCTDINHVIVFLMIATLYPLVTIFSYFNDRIRKFISAYPVNYFCDWGGKLYMVILMYLVGYYCRAYHFIFKCPENQVTCLSLKWENDREELMTVTGLMFFTCLFTLAKIYEEVFELFDSEQSDFFGQLSVYLSDKWNKFDILVMLTYVGFIFIQFVKFNFLSTDTINRYADIESALFFFAMITSCFNLAQVLLYSEKLGNTTEATINMIFAVMDYFVVLAIIILGFVLSGHVLFMDESARSYPNSNLVFNSTESPQYYHSVSDICWLGFKAVTGIFEVTEFTDGEDRMDFTRKEKIYWGVFFILIVIICINGMVSIMTLSLDTDMSDEATRQRSNYTKYNLMKFHQEWDYWPLPFNLFKAWKEQISKKCEVLSIWVSNRFKKSDNQDEENERRPALAGLTDKFKFSRASHNPTCVLRVGEKISEDIIRECKKLSRQISMKLTLCYMLEEDAITYLWRERKADPILDSKSTNNYFKKRSSVSSETSESESEYDFERKIKDNLFVYLAKMNLLCSERHEQIQNIISEYVDDESMSFMKPLKSYQDSTAMHLMFKVEV